jgi:hypothetical protein
MTPEVSGRLLQAILGISIDTIYSPRSQLPFILDTSRRPGTQRLLWHDIEWPS